MPDIKARTAALLASPEDAETQFYEAMRDGDIDRMMALWADDEDIVCVHPGGARLVGPNAVRSAFEAIFANGPVAVQAEHVKRVRSMDASVHSVLERVDVTTAEGPRTGWVVATNVYVKSTRGWRMVAHHASPGALDEAASAEEPPAILH